MKNFLLSLFWIIALNSAFADDTLEQRTIDFDKDAKQWATQTLISTLSFTTDNWSSVFKSQVKKYTPTSWQQLQSFLGSPDGSAINYGMSAEAKGEVKTQLRGVLIRQFFWDIKVPLKIHCMNHKEYKLSATVRVVNSVGRVNPSTFVIHSLAFSEKNPCATISNT